MKIHSNQNQSVIIDVIDLREVKKFTYLGCEVKENGDVRNEVGIRNGKTGASFRSSIRSGICTIYFLLRNLNFSTL